MSEDYKTTKIPALRRHGIQTWLEEFKGALMGYKRSHLALKDPRPEPEEEKLDEYTNQPAKLRTYLSDVKDDQEDWDERNDIVLSRLLESVKDNDNSEARQMIYAGIKDDKTALELVESLTKRFDSTDSRVINAAIKRFTAMKAASGEKATSFITRLKEQQEQLKQKGKTFSDG